MVTTRSNRTSYTIDLPNESKPIRTIKAPITKYFSCLDGSEKSALINKKSLPINRLALIFHWFLRNIVPMKKSDIEEDFDDLFCRIQRGDYPSFVRRVFSKDRRRRSDKMVFFRRSLKCFYEQIYGPNRLFNIIKDDVLGHKVIIHENLFQLHGNKRTGKIPFHAVSESLVGALFTCHQADLLSVLNHNSVYEYNRTKYVLTGPLYFVPHHCDSMLSFDKPYMNDLFGVNVPTVKLFTEDPHSSLFKVGDSVTVNYHMGEHASEFNFTCACGSSNCISLNK